MARKRMDRLEMTSPEGELPDHLHAHIAGFYTQETRPDMVVTVVELTLFGGANDGEVVRIALCPNCMLKLWDVTTALMGKYPKHLRNN